MEGQKVFVSGSQFQFLPACAALRSLFYPECPDDGGATQKRTKPPDLYYYANVCILVMAKIQYPDAPTVCLAE